MTISSQGRKLVDFWPVLAPIAGAIVASIWWVHDVNGSVSKIDALEAVQATQTTSLAVLSNQVQETHDQVKDIWQAMRLDRHKK